MIGTHTPPEHYRSPIVRFGLRFAAVILVIAGVITTFTVTASTRDARASTNWPSVPGRVSESTVVELTTGSKQSFRPSVSYDYVVGGRTYTNRAIGFSEIGGSGRASAEGVVARYSAGSTVTVYYSPTDPQNAVLERGAPPRVYAMALIPPALIVIGVVLWRAQRADDGRPKSE